jgi:hypothetical protein
VEYVPAGPEWPVAPDWTLTTPTLRPEGYARVAGESFRQDALRTHLVAAAPHRLVIAQLVRDRHNPHDSAAVAVFIGSDLVGYIPRAELGHEAQSLYKALARLARRDAPAAWAFAAVGRSDRAGWLGTRRRGSLSCRCGRDS